MDIQDGNSRYHFPNIGKWGIAVFSLTHPEFIRRFFHVLFRNRYLIGYIVIGFSSLVIEAVTVYSLPASLSFTIRLAIGFIFGLAFAFVGNAFFNFRVRRSKLFYSLFMFCLLSLISLLANNFLRNYLFPDNMVPYPFDRFIVSGIIFLFAFYLHRLFTFKGSWRNFCFGVAINDLIEGEDSLGKNVVGNRLAIADLCDCIHVNIADSSFCPGFDGVNSLGLSKLFETRPESRVHLHLMTRRPLATIDSLSAAGKVETIIFHPNCDDDPFQVIARCLELGCKPGLAWSRDIKLAEILPLIPHVDFVLCMVGVNGGEAAQMVAEEIRVSATLYALAHRHGGNFIVEGNIRPDNVANLQADYYVPPHDMLLNEEPLLAALRLGKKEINGISCRAELLNLLWNVVDSIEWILSATLVGGFSRTDDLSAASDIDFVVVVDELTKKRYEELQAKMSQAIQSPLKKAGFEFKLNASKGPLKFNDYNTAVLHLMCYSIEEHRRHVRESPFTCLDWQRSPLWRKNRYAKYIQVLGSSLGIFSQNGEDAPTISQIYQKGQ